MDEPAPVAPQDDGLQTSKDDLLAAVAAIDEMTSVVTTDDLSSAFADEEYSWTIATGKLDANGRPLALNVKVRDPRRQELPTQYVDAVIKRGEEAAGIGLWQACIVSPVALKNPENYKRTTTAFRATLTHRLMLMVGLNNDFFEAMMATRTSATSRQVVRPSFSTSPPISALTQESSVASRPVNSITLGSTSNVPIELPVPT